MALKNVREMYSTHCEGNAERFIKTLKKQILKIYDFNIKKCVYW